MTQDIQGILDNSATLEIILAEPVLDDATITSLLETSMQHVSINLPTSILQAMTTRGFYHLEITRQKVYLRDAVKQGHMVSLMFPEPRHKQFAEALDRFRSFPSFECFGFSIAYISHVYQFPGILRAAMLEHVNQAWNTKELGFPGTITSMTKTM